MECIKQPSKEQVRNWLTSRKQCLTPLPSIGEIRHQLGWSWSIPISALSIHQKAA